MEKPSVARRYIERLLAQPAKEAGGLDKIPDQYYFGYDQSAKVQMVISFLESIDPALVAEWLSEEELTRYTELRLTLVDSMAKWRSETVQERKLTGGHRLPMQRLAEIALLLGRFQSDDVKPDLFSKRFHFVQDPDLQKSLGNDLISLERLIRLNEWKAATVIGGSIVEALLLDKLEAREATAKDVLPLGATKKFPPVIADWKLEQMIQASVALGIITTEDQKACSLSQQYRNLIHPSVERARTPSGEHTAAQAHATILRLLDKWG